MKTLFDQQYSADFTEKCRNAIEANFGEIVLPKSFGRKKGNIEVEPVFIIELIHKTKSVNKGRVNKNKKGKKRNLVIKIKTNQIMKNMKSPIFF